MAHGRYVTMQDVCGSHTRGTCTYFLIYTRPRAQERLTKVNVISTVNGRTNSN